MHENLINQAFDTIHTLDANNPPSKLLAAVEQTMLALDSGAIRSAEKVGSKWVVHEWVKKAILLSFRLSKNHVVELGNLVGFDKVPLKFTGWDEQRFNTSGIRVVPPATVRRGAYIAPQCV